MGIQNYTQLGHFNYVWLMFHLPKRVILHLIRFFYQIFFIGYIIQRTNKQITIVFLLCFLNLKIKIIQLQASFIFTRMRVSSF